MIIHIDLGGGDKFFFDGKGFSKSLPPYKLLKCFFSVSALNKTYRDKLEKSPTKGLDRLNGFQFSKQLNGQVSVINKKCLSGKYLFTPFAEVLQLKGRMRHPRLIGIPVVRDRLVLHQLKEVLSHVFPECVPKSRANTLVHDISRHIKSIYAAGKGDEIYLFNCDIKSFYDKIQRSKLLEILGQKIRSSKVLKLIEAAISTPIVPRGYRRKDISKYASTEGIPQGLAISNILAAIYLSSFDKVMKSVSGISYYRYVDDILVIGGDAEVNAMPALVENELDSIGLEIHGVGSGKRHLDKLSAPFEYLGYRFVAPLVTVRDTTVERFLLAVVAKFSEYVHNKTNRLEKHKHLTEDRLKSIFIMELNERITGAISEKTKYGWVSYFCEINDLDLLHRLDSTIKGFFTRLVDFGRLPPPELKTLVRAYYEMRYSPERGYIHNYDSFVTLASKIKFLNERNRLNPEKTYSDEEIESIFLAYRNRNLASLQADDGSMY